MLKKVTFSVIASCFGFIAVVAMPQQYHFKDNYPEEIKPQIIACKGKAYIDALGKKPGCSVTSKESLLFPIEKDHLRVLAVAVAMLLLFIMGMGLFSRWANLSVLAFALSTVCCFYLTQTASVSWYSYKAHKNLDGKPLIKINSQYIELHDYNVTPVALKRFSWNKIPHVEHRWIYHLVGGSVTTRNHHIVFQARDKKVIGVIEDDPVFPLSMEDIMQLIMWYRNS